MIPAYQFSIDPESPEFQLGKKLYDAEWMYSQLLKGIEVEPERIKELIGQYCRLINAVGQLKADCNKLRSMFTLRERLVVQLIESNIPCLSSNQNHILIQTKRQRDEKLIIHVAFDGESIRINKDHEIHPDAPPRTTSETFPAKHYQEDPHRFVQKINDLLHGFSPV
jgi:hypothetical protein